MSTDIAPYETHTAIVLADPTGGRLVAWAEAATAAHQLAIALSKTSFVPAGFQGQENNITAALLLGDELGLSPIAALRSIYVVHGNPALYARSMVALAQSHGHEIWTEKTSPSEVVVCGRRRGSDHVERSSWTIARATKAKYTSNSKYGSNPEEMLWSKAASEVARKIAADVLAGVPYSVEDLELEELYPTTAVARTAPASRTRVQRGKAPVPEEPSLEDEPVGRRVSGAGDDTGVSRAPAPAGESVAGAVIADSPPATPTDDQPSEPHPQRVAIAARTAGLDDEGRHQVAYIASEGRVASSAALTKEEGDRALAICRDIGEKTARVEMRDGVPVLISETFGWPTEAVIDVEPEESRDGWTLEQWRQDLKARCEYLISKGVDVKAACATAGFPPLSRMGSADLAARVALVEQLEAEAPF